MNLGYACINMTIGKKVTTNRTMVKRTLQSKGLDYVSELALLNAKDVIRILEWNRLNGISLFRLSSALIPWGDNIDITQLKDYKEIKSELKKAGDFAKFWNMRINSHPGPFNVLVSPSESVVEKTIADLELHGKVFDMMGLSKTPYNNINIHCNVFTEIKKQQWIDFVRTSKDSLNRFKVGLQLRTMIKVLCILLKI